MAILKDKVLLLRGRGKTYAEIQQILGHKIPKSTLSYWCRHLSLPLKYEAKIKELVKNGASRGRAVALATNTKKREDYINSIKQRNLRIPKLLSNINVSKLVLSILYITEGGKKQRGSLMLGNSDPRIIRLFLKLLRLCYVIDEKKFRCTLQCRADQKTKDLEEFWSKTTNIPLNQFYKAQIDPRTIDRPSKKPDYKGVCRVDYFSADIFNELVIICDLINK